MQVHRPDLIHLSPDLGQKRGDLMLKLVRRVFAMVVGFGSFQFRTQVVAERPVQVPSLNVVAIFAKYGEATNGAKDGGSLGGSFNLSNSLDPGSGAPGVQGTGVKRLQMKKDELEPHRYWPEFHVGVITALKSRNLPERGVPPNIEHHKLGGYFFGLGLQGALGSIGVTRILEQLEQRHDMVSGGLLLGIAVQQLGTAASTEGRLIKVHLENRSPKVGDVTLEAAIMGIGLLNLGTCGTPTTNTILDKVAKHDICAGAACGLVNLSQGTTYLLHRMKASYKGSFSAAEIEGETPNANSNISAGFALCIGLSFMNSGHNEAAETIRPPAHSPDDLEKLRYDDTVLRQMAYHLVMLENVEPSIDWADKQVPEYIQSKLTALQENPPTKFVYQANLAAKKNMKDRTPSSFAGIGHGPRVPKWMYLLDEGLYLEELEVYCAYRVAAASAIALKYRTIPGDKRVSYTLQLMTDEIMECLVAHRSKKQFSRRTQVFRNTVDAMLLYWSLVEAGTGHIELYRRTCAMHYKVFEDRMFPSHMATHMALGFLFLGEGNYTFQQQKSLFSSRTQMDAETPNLDDYIAIAALWLSCYPVFGTMPEDDKTFFQPLRHLWVLAATRKPSEDSASQDNLEDAVPKLVKERILQEDFADIPDVLRPKDGFDVEPLLFESPSSKTFKYRSSRFIGNSLADKSNALLESPTAMPAMGNSPLGFSKMPLEPTDGSGKRRRMY